MKPNEVKCDLNISEQMKRIEKSRIFKITTENHGLFNLREKQATECQRNDLLHFRIVGEQEFKQRIAATILKQPSVQAPNRRKRFRHLQTRR